MPWFWCARSATQCCATCSSDDHVSRWRAAQPNSKFTITTFFARTVALDVVFPSLMERIIIARRFCPVCKGEMLIEDGRTRKALGDGAKKPPKRVRSNVSKATGSK